MCISCLAEHAGYKASVRATIERADERGNGYPSVGPEDIAWAWVTPAMLDTVRLIDRLYVVHSVGGPLHVELEDDNLDDHFFEHTIEDRRRYYQEWQEKWGDYPDPLDPDGGTPAVALAIYTAYSGMTKAQRATTSALHRHYLHRSAGLPLPLI